VALIDDGYTSDKDLIRALIVDVVGSPPERKRHCVAILREEATDRFERYEQLIPVRHIANLYDLRVVRFRLLSPERIKETSVVRAVTYELGPKDIETVRVGGPEIIGGTAPTRDADHAMYTLKATTSPEADDSHWQKCECISIYSITPETQPCGWAG